VAIVGRGRKRPLRKERKLQDIATAEAADILRDGTRGSEWQGDRGRSVRRKPIPLSSKSSKTGAFGRRSREREPAEAEMLRLGTRNARRRAACSSEQDNRTRDSGGWWRHQPPLRFGAESRPASRPARRGGRLRISASRDAHWRPVDSPTSGPSRIRARRGPISSRADSPLNAAPIAFTRPYSAGGRRRRRRSRECRRRTGRAGRPPPRQARYSARAGARHRQARRPSALPEPRARGPDGTGSALERAMSGSTPRAATGRSLCDSLFGRK
jgi:hypothetical protein